MTEGYLALARGEHGRSADRLAAMVEQLRGFNVENVPEAFTDLVRALLRAGRAPPTAPRSADTRRGPRPPAAGTRPRPSPSANRRRAFGSTRRGRWSIS